MTEGRDEPGANETSRPIGGEPPADETTIEPAAADLTGATEPPPDLTSEPPADEPPSEPPTIGWATGVQWEPAAEEPRVLPPAGVTLQVGSAIGRTLDTFLRHWTLFVLLAIPTAIMGAVATIVLGSSNVALALLVSLMSLIVGVVVSLAMIVATDDLRAGRNPSFGDVIGRALGRTSAGLLSTVVEFLAYFGILIVPAVVALGLISSSQIGGGGTGAIIGALLTIGIVAVIAVIAIRWALSQAAIVLDRFGPIQGLNRSRIVTKGNAWRLFGLFLAFGLLFLPLSIGLGILSVGSISPLAFVIIGVSSLISGPLSAISIATAYGDLTGRPAVDPMPRSTGSARSILVAAILVVGVIALAIGVPTVGRRFSELALGQIPIEDRGKILTGTSRDPLQPCRPTNLQTTFASTDTLYVGGFFTRTIPAGESGTVEFYIDGQLSNTAPLSSATQSVGCYYEPDPATGVPPATYRLVVKYAGETIAEGTFTVR
jgi:uncharacterized membrane protein